MEWAYDIYRSNGHEGSVNKYQRVHQRMDLTCKSLGHLLQQFLMLLDKKTPQAERVELHQGKNFPYYKFLCRSVLKINPDSLMNCKTKSSLDLKDNNDNYIFTALFHKKAYQVCFPTKRKILLNK